MYQLGFDLQAVPSTFCWNKSATGAPLSGPDQLLLFLGEITCKGRDAILFQPNASVCNLDMGKNIGCRKLLLQTLCCLVGIRAKRSDVDKRCNSRVDASSRDDRATVGMTDQDRGIAYTAQGSLHAIDLAGV